MEYNQIKYFDTGTILQMKSHNDYFQSTEIDRHMNYGTMPEQDDLPPKYEDCEELPPEYFEEEQPPVYDEATMRPDNLYSNKCDNSIIIFDRNYCYENKTFQL